jgi:hypothetical protein
MIVNDVFVLLKIIQLYTCLILLKYRMRIFNIVRRERVVSKILKNEFNQILW